MGRVRRRLLLLLGLLALASAGLAAPALAQLPIPLPTPTPTVVARRSTPTPTPRLRRPRHCCLRRPSCSSPSWPATPSPRPACSCAGADAGRTTAGPAASSSTCARYACAPRRTGARSSPERPRGRRPSPARRGRPTWCGRGRARRTPPSTGRRERDRARAARRARPPRQAVARLAQAAPARRLERRHARRLVPAGHGDAALHPAPRPRDRAPLPVRRPARGLARRPPHASSASPVPPASGRSRSIRGPSAAAPTGSP